MKNNDIELSIVIPSLNEKLTIGKFIDWCHEGIKKSKITAEIIIVDSSDDNTAKIAKSKGARVIKTPKRGLGQAYIDSISHIRGKYILMGDCDLTYDFRDLSFFIAAFRNGYDFVMGSRYKGSIEKKAMPFLHQYFGTPITTFILNCIYGSHFSDIHCGMRGITKNALIKINLESSGWEYASEMVIKSVRYKLKTTEVPVFFYKDIEGRLSHLKRNGFLTPWIAAWDNLKVMFIYTPDSLMLKPSYIFFTASIFLFFNYFYLKNSSEVIVSLYFAFTLLSLSIFLFFYGIFFRCFHSLRNGIELKVLKFLSYNRGMLMGLFFLLIAFLFTINSILSFLPFNINPLVALYFFNLSIMLIVFTVGLELLRKKNYENK